MKAQIRFYIALFLRRIHWFLLIFVAVTAASLTIANVLPPVYVSATRLLVEPPQIPQRLAASTVQTGSREELQIIQQRLMTRVNLLDIARSENVFKNIGTMSPDQVVGAMRGATSIQLNVGNNQATIMNIEFESNRAETAAAVVNRYVTLILQDNAEFRTGRAGKTLEFFEVEVERLGNELEKQSAAIMAFNSANADALPSTLNFRLSQQGNLQQRISTLERDITNLQDQRQRLLDVFQSTGSVNVQNAPMSPEQQQLVNLENQLNTALLTFSRTNPKVRLLEAQVAQQREVVNNLAGVNSGSGSDSNSILDVQLADIDARVAVFEEELVDANEQLAEVVASIERTPAVQIQLNALNRDYSNIQQQYNQAVSGMASAATGERIELLAQGQRISVIDPATVPSRPSKPPRTLIALGGTLFGALLGLAVVIGLEFLNNAIRRPVDITKSLGITPLMTIPYVRTPMENVARRAMLATILIGMGVGIPIALYAVHTYYLPLDLIYERIAGRIGTIL